MGVISALENRYVRVNQAMAELLDMTVDEILASNPFSLALRVAHPDELVEEQKIFAELAAGARTFYRIEKRYMRRDGSWRWGLLTFSGIHGAPIAPATPVGPLRYVVANVVDIGERKALEETLRRREEELRHAQKVDGIGRLAAGVAHDFNNLLTIITGHGEMLKTRVTKAAAQLSPSTLTDGIDAILEASERAANLTTQLLAYGRREVVSPRTFVLSDAVRKMDRLLGRTIGSNVEVDLALDAQGAVLADQGHVGQIVLNLVLNARDAISQAGRIGLVTRDVLVAAGETTPPGPGAWVALSVSDDGQGMSPEVAERMFEPFFTTRDDRPGTRGTGLGLATVQRIVAEAGGIIDVDTAVGRGTTVTIFFPRAARSIAAGPQANHTGRPAAPPNSRRVLVVEDEPAVRSLVATVLLGAHYWVLVARDGEEAMRVLASEAEPFHLIVTDMMMPRSGGMAFVRRLRDRGDQTRVLFISGYSHLVPADIAPFGGILAKPFTPTQLLETVERVLDEPPRASG